MLTANCTLHTAGRVSRPWLVLERLSPAFTQAVATAMGIAAGLPSAVRALTRNPRSLVNYVG